MKLLFRQPLLAFFLVVFLTSLFAGLGRWQLDRAAEKTAILETYHRHAAAPAVALPPKLNEPVSWRHRKVRVTATPLPERQFLLDNQIRKGRAGFSVLTPFRAAHGALLLVDRGWLPLGASRQDLPDISIPAVAMALEGLVYVPYGEPFSLGGMDDGELGWPRIIQFADFDTLAMRLGEPLRPFTLRLDPAAQHGYLRDWQITALSPNTHLAYAFQWFALATTVIAITVILSLRRRRKK